MGWDVFIISSSKNKKEADYVYQKLTNAGISVWKDQEALMYGDRYLKEVTDGLKNCKIMVLLLSKESQKSIWVTKELTLAVERRKTIIPIRLDNSPIRDEFAFMLNDIHCPENVSLKDDIKQAVEKILLDANREMVMGHDVFIISSSKNRKKANYVYKELTKAGISVWKDQEALTFGDRYLDVATAGIKNCKIMVLLLSKESQKSVWATKELTLAVKNRKTIIPIRLDNSPIRDEFAFMLDDIPFSGNINLKDDIKQAVEKIKQILDGGSFA